MDPFRLYIVVRRGAFDSIDEGGRLAGIAAVSVLHEFPPAEEWRQRPGKVVLRARSPSQWDRVLEDSRTRQRATASSRSRPAGAPSAATC